jgi:hypothetical protein
MTDKHPARGKRGMVITNHPLASAAGAEMLAAGGNARASTSARWASAPPKRFTCWLRF